MSGATLDSVEAVVRALGGPRAVRQLTGRTPQTVWNWRRANRFPAKTFVKLQAALHEAGEEASAELWGQS